jgi:hypothetical protein
MRAGLAVLLIGLSWNAYGQTAIAFTRVTVMDVARGELRPNQTVVIAGNRIAAAEDSGRVTVPRGASVIDGRWRFLIPVADGRLYDRAGLDALLPR